MGFRVCVSRIATSREHCISNWKPQQLMKGLCQTTHSHTAIVCDVFSLFFDSLQFEFRSNSNFGQSASIAEFCSTKDMRKRGKNYWILMKPKNQVTLNAIRGQNKSCKCDLFLRHFVFDMHGFRSNYASISDSKLDFTSLFQMPRVCVILKSLNRVAIGIVYWQFFVRRTKRRFICWIAYSIRLGSQLVARHLRRAKSAFVYTQHVWSIWFVFEYAFEL